MMLLMDFGPYMIIFMTMCILLQIFPLVFTGNLLVSKYYVFVVGLILNVSGCIF
jgi:hypothetical protein